jgi:hypothetical protein
MKVVSAAAAETADGDANPIVRRGHDIRTGQGNDARGAGFQETTTIHLSTSTMPGSEKKKRAEFLAHAPGIPPSGNVEELLD